VLVKSTTIKWLVDKRPQHLQTSIVSVSVPPFLFLVFRR
jgi:hypothetical protein